MDDIAIKVTGLGKKFRKFSGSGLSLLKNPATSKNTFWALQDVNFEIEKGKGLGIIGGNGSGKSTLLKILAKIIPPTTGQAEIDGRVNSLLEVGTGFQSDLSGRANIYLNASILGMTKKDIDMVYNDIVEFSGIGDFIDMPVKHYSSGMYSRLAFSVAAHVTGDILLVDEVLSVGDASFRQKCLTRMNSLLGSDKRTVLFVSHSMESVMKFCTKCIWLDKGIVRAFGDSEDVIQEYLKSVRQLGSKTIAKAKTDEDSQNSSEQPQTDKEANTPAQNEKPVENAGVTAFRDSVMDSAANIYRVMMTDAKGQEKEMFKRSDSISVTLFCEVFSTNPDIHAIFHLLCHPRKGVDQEVHVFSSVSETILPKEKGEYKVTVKVPSEFLATGYYTISVALITNAKSIIRHCKLERIATFYVIDDNVDQTFLSERLFGVIYPKLDWKITLADPMEAFD